MEIIQMLSHAHMFSFVVLLFDFLFALFLGLYSWVYLFKTLQVAKQMGLSLPSNLPHIVRGIMGLVAVCVFLIVIVLITIR
jgi:hypothetical protein